MEFQSYASNQIYKRAGKYGIKAKAISYNDSLIELEYKGKKELIKQTATRFTNIIQGRICDNKFLAIQYLKENGIENIPKNIVINKLKDLDKENISYPVVVKPLKGHGGIGVSVDIKNGNELKKAFLLAKKNNPQIVIEEYIPGDDYRFLVVGKKVFVAKRLGANIEGNGKDTIKELIKNENIKRNKMKKLLVPIEIDEEVIRTLDSQKLKIESILNNKEIVFLRKNANLSTGGTVIDYTENIHPENKKLALKIAKIMKMKVIAIDFLFKDPTQKYSKENGIIIEINDTPGLRIHHPREEEIVKNLFNILFPTLK